MEAKKEEALKAIENAEKRFSHRDFVGAKSYALKAKTLCPGLEGISQLVTTFEVYIASQVTCNGELDWYSIMGLNPSTNIEAVKKQYKKMAGLLHPDNNKCVGADGAFHLVSEAWARLSGSYDMKRNAQLGAGNGVNHKGLSSVHASGGNQDTFWTICTSCKVQYEYLRKYVNKKLSCKNCRGIFIALETAPANGSFPYSPWSYGSSSGYGSHSYDGVTYVPTNGAYFNGNGVPGYHSKHGYEYVSNVPYQLGSAGYVNQNGSTTLSACQTNGKAKRGRPKVKSGADRKHCLTETVVNISSDVSFSRNEPQEVKPSRPEKKRKVLGASLRNVHEGKGSKCASELALANGNGSVGHGQRISSTSEIPTKQYSMAPAFDARKLLIEKARTEIRKKLEEMKLASETAAAVIEGKKSQADVGQVKGDICTKTALNVSDNQLEHRKTVPVTITVPDPDFHDFDKDRSEPCFKPKQIWALYDEEDGMPRLYCLIREVVSVNPFKINISYLSSKTDSEFAQIYGNETTTMLPNQTKVTIALRCEVCKVDVNSKDSYDSHIAGKKHKKNLQIQTNPTIASHANVQTDTSSIQGQALIGPVAKQSEPKKQVDSATVCSTCNVLCTSQDAYIKHLAGRKHAAQVALMSNNGIGPSIAEFKRNGVGPFQKAAKKIKVAQSVWCEVCKINCNSRDIYITHLAGKKHLKTLEKQSNPKIDVGTSGTSTATTTAIAPNTLIGPQEKPGTDQPKPKKASELDIETKKRKVVEGGAAVDGIKMCTLCNVVCNSQTVFNFHLVGQKHAAMVKKAGSVTG